MAERYPDFSTAESRFTFRYSYTHTLSRCTRQQRLPIRFPCVPRPQQDDQLITCITLARIFLLLVDFKYLCNTPNVIFCLATIPSPNISNCAAICVGCAECIRASPFPVSTFIAMVRLSYSSSHAFLGVQAPLGRVGTIAGFIGRLETRTVANQRLQIRI